MGEEAASKDANTSLKIVTTRGLQVLERRTQFEGHDDMEVVDTNTKGFTCNMIMIEELPDGYFKEIEPQAGALIMGPS